MMIIALGTVSRLLQNGFGIITKRFWDYYENGFRIITETVLRLLQKRF